MNRLKLKKLLLVMLLSTASLWAGFTHVHCDNDNNLTILNITKGDCLALESFWDATGQGNGWTSEQDPKLQWDRLVSAKEWYGVYLYKTGGVITFIIRDNNITGTLPDGLASFTNIIAIGVPDNHFSGHFPQDLHNEESILLIDLSRNHYMGNLPSYSELPINLTMLEFQENNFTGSIPSEYSRYNVKEFTVSYNPLSGPLPSLLGWENLDRFYIYDNNFTFSDIEPQIGYIKYLSKVVYSKQADINETGHIVYFSDTLRIEPRLEANPSKHDYYIWKKDNTVIEDTRTYSNENFSQSRIYVKENASPADAGCYSYDVNNSRVTLPDNGGAILRHLVLHSSTCIEAKYNRAPVVKHAPEAVVTWNADTNTYNYTPQASDPDGDALSFSITSTPSWANFEPSTGGLSGLPTNEDVGNYDINITVTDGKTPIYINYVLTILSKGLELQPSVGSVTEIYTHIDTGSSIATTLANPRLRWNQQGGTKLAMFIETNYCSPSIYRAYVGFRNSSGVLQTGYLTCGKPPVLKNTVKGNTYPNGSTATLLKEPGTNKVMIMVDIPLTAASPSITIGTD